MAIRLALNNGALVDYLSALRYGAMTRKFYQETALVRTEEHMSMCLMLLESVQQSAKFQLFVKDARVNNADYWSHSSSVMLLASQYANDFPVAELAVTTQNLNELRKSLLEQRKHAESIANEASRLRDERAAHERQMSSAMNALSQREAALNDLARELAEKSSSLSTSSTTTTLMISPTPVLLDEQKAKDDDDNDHENDVESNDNDEIEETNVRSTSTMATALPTAATTHLPEPTYQLDELDTMLLELTKQAASTSASESRQCQWSKKYSIGLAGMVSIEGKS